MLELIVVVYVLLYALRVVYLAQFGIYIVTSNLLVDLTHSFDSVFVMGVNTRNICPVELFDW